MESVVRGGTKWKRFAVVMVPGIAATAVIGMALAQGALAASFAVSGQNFKVSADELHGFGFVQYGAMDAQVGGTTVPVAVSGFNNADITKMCQSVITHVPVFGDVTLRLEAGGKGTPVHAENLYIDLDQLNADAEFKNINIGVPAGAAGNNKDATGIDGPHKAGQGPQNPGAFAQEAQEATLTKVQQTAWATSAGTFKLSGLSLSVKKGNNECY
ncbi:DUF6230 family protein [Streptomyces fildesensis]|uniref:DUF6230 family protein n=1 Tax=Streptomyces fildesensis TaxID=375757 RepID=A0ABW8C165_9ACTN